MAPLAEVIAGLRHALNHIAAARTHLSRAAAAVTAAHQRYRTVLTGSTDPATHQAIRHTAPAVVTDQIPALDRAEQLIRDYLHRITDGQSPAEASDRPPPPIPNRRIDETRAGLRRGPDGSQTTGWWLRRDGDLVRLRSGQDDDPDGWQQRARRLLQEKFPHARPDLLALSRHVEVQLAMRSHAEKFEHEVLVIDRPVCGRDARTRSRKYTCDEYLPYLLAEGAALTVVEKDGSRVTYVGRRKQCP